MFWVGLVIICLVSSILAHKIYGLSYTPLELGLQALVPILVGGIGYLIIESSESTDTEYWNDLVITLRHEGKYEEWVDKTCSRERCSGSGNDRKCTTEYYDCSYCSTTYPDYFLVGKSGKKYRIEKETYYKYLSYFRVKEKWLGKRKNLRHRMLCNEDEGIWEAYWDGDTLRPVNATSKHSYTNKVVKSSTLYQRKKLSEEELSRTLDYPDVIDHRQRNIQYNTEFPSINHAETHLEYYNGKWGHQKQLKVFIFITEYTSDEDLDNQVTRLENGNKNEFILVLGVENEQIVNWRFATWNRNPNAITELDRYLYEEKPKDALEISKKVTSVLDTNWTRQEFTLLNEVSIIYLSDWEVALLLILSALASFGVSFWFSTNELE